MLLSDLGDHLIRCVTSYPLKGNVVRVPGKEELSRAEEEGQEYRRMTKRKLELKRSMKILTLRAGHPCWL